MHMRFAAGIAFLSGFVALGYEILWAHRLSDIIGATAFASSLVVGAFFLFLAMGALVLGPRATRSTSPWRFYARLEIAIVVAILPSFFGETLARLVFGIFGETLLENPAGLIVKSLLAVLFVGPASFLMGGTLPAMGQAVVRSSERLGREGNTLYGLHTLGAAAGILVTTFVLVSRLGMMQSFVVLMLASLGLAWAAWRLGAHDSAAGTRARNVATSADAADAQELEDDEEYDDLEEDEGWLAPGWWNTLAFFAGFTVLGLEILALHLFAQVLHNSTYTFASVLLVVILALSVGALVTRRLSLSPQKAWHGAGLVLLGGAVFMAILPRLFNLVTGDLQPFSAAGAGLGLYVLRILGVGALVLGPPFVLLGWVFPLLLAGRGSSAFDDDDRPAIGRHWGGLLAINAVGALIGMAVVNHLALPRLGLWLTLTLWCLVALLGGVMVSFRALGAARFGMWGLIIAVGAGIVWSNPRTLPIARLDEGERLVSWNAGPDGVVSVIERNQPFRDMRIQWNNSNSLGGASNAAQQMRLGFIPLLLHERPEHVAFIGMGTGITAGSALRDPVQPRVTTVELSPQVTRLSCEHFSALSARLCDSDRSRVVNEDGRMFFHATRDTFDVVVGDLFVPWRAGVANLFTREHFENVRRRLDDNGLFAQWVPLFQLDETAFWGIAATFEQVFPNAWLAIADFQPQNAAVALIGWKNPSGAPDWQVMQTRTGQIRSIRTNREAVLRSAEGLAMFLVGPVRESIPDEARLMTQNRPWLGDHAARIERMHPPPLLQGQLLVNELQKIAGRMPPGTLRDNIILGQLLYQFSGIAESHGMEIATAWFDEHITQDLPEVIARPRPKRWSWPFSQATGRFLVRRALEDAGHQPSTPRSP